MINLFRTTPRPEGHGFSRAASRQKLTGALAPAGLLSAFAAKRFAQIFLVAILAVTMLGAADSTKRFNRVGKNLMCTCGCNQQLLECNHMGCPDSGPMIAELHNQIDLGTASDQQILATFTAKYGGTVLAAPIRGGFDIVAWILPLGLLLAAILGTAYVVRAWATNRRATLGPATIPDTDLDQALRDKIRRDTEY